MVTPTAEAPVVPPAPVREGKDRKKTNNGGRGPAKANWVPRRKPSTRAEVNYAPGLNFRPAIDVSLIRTTRTRCRKTQQAKRWIKTADQRLGLEPHQSRST